MIRWLLDTSYYVRRWTVRRLVHLCMCLYGVELTYDQVCRESNDRNEHSDRNLDDAKDLDALLTVAKGCWASAVERRKGVTDKCKTLLTISALLLGLCGFLLPGALQFEPTWMRIVFFCAGLMLLITVTLLVEYFGVRAEMSISLDQEDVSLNSKDLKKNLINLHLRCQAAADNTSDFLADMYKTARFFFLSAVFLVAILFSVSYLAGSKSSVAEEVVRELRSDPALIDLLQGPKGDKGDGGARGAAGNDGRNGRDGTDAVVEVENIVDAILEDERFRKAASQSDSERGTAK